jgi:hypothetical protein
MSQSATATASYTYADIEKVVTRVRADLMMIGDSTGGWTSDQIQNYAHDIELLAVGGYLKHVDVTLLQGSAEICAARFVVNTNASGWVSSRPGGVRWPRVENGWLRIVLAYNSTYTDAAREAVKSKLKIGWVTSTADTSHVTLSQSGGRDYASNSYGIERADWS